MKKFRGTFKTLSNILDVVFYKKPLNISLDVEQCSEYTSEICLTLSGPRPLSYRNQSIDLQNKSMVLFLCDRDIRHERVNIIFIEMLNFRIKV